MNNLKEKNTQNIDNRQQTANEGDRPLKGKVTRNEKGRFKRGTKAPNPTGRPIGIKDKRVFRYEVWQKLVEYGHDPIVNLIKIAEDPTWEQQYRLKAEIELADRIAPRLKCIEIKADTDDLQEIAELKKMFSEFNALYEKSY